MFELTNIIRSEISAQGPITFARFMELALYYPGLGYYETEQKRVGFQGDFYTSVSTGELFGQLLAFRFAQWLDALPTAPDHLWIIEAGAHDGQLARDILGWLRTQRPELFSRLRYGIIDPSAQRQAWQQEKLAEFGEQVRWFDRLAEVGHLTVAAPLPSPNQGLSHDPLNRINRLDCPATADHSPSPEGEGRGEGGRIPVPIRTNIALPAHGEASNPLTPANTAGRISGIIFSNELLDAMPVHRLGWDAGGRVWFECGVAWDGVTFVWTRLADGQPNGLGVKDLPVELLSVLPDGYTIEVSPAAEAWWRAAAGCLQHGKLLAIDYGVTQEELISPARTNGTLRGYHQHQFSDNVLAHPGEQDLTAHVNFSAIQAAGASAGLQTDGYLTQPQFLTGILGEAIQDPSFREWNTRRTRQFQTLTHPQHLGQSFKVLIQAR